MKILFATPPLRHHSFHGKQTNAGTWKYSPSLGLLSLAAIARCAGHTVAVLDAVAMQLSQEEFHSRLNHFAPDILALSATTTTINWAAAAAQAAKKSSPNLLVILGGAHVTAVPEETMARFNSIDVAVVGEGEATLYDLLAALDEGRSLQSVDGLYLREGGGGFLTGHRAPIADLDSLPLPAWDLLEGFPKRYSAAPYAVKQLPIATLVSSRGCPNRCIFCDRSVFGGRSRFYSAEKILFMVQTLWEHFGVREICFDDDTFIRDQRRLVSTCSGLIELNLGVTWSCLARVNQVKADTLALMRRSGCWQISFGIESGSQRILDLIGKNTTLECIRNAVDMSRDAGLHVRGFFIIGHPGETFQTMRETLDFALSLPLNDISVSLMTPFPGTKLYERATEFGEMNFSWEKMNQVTPVFVPSGLSAEDLVNVRRELLRRFYLRPRVIGDYAIRLLQRPSLILPVANRAASLLGKIH